MPSRAIAVLGVVAVLSVSVTLTVHAQESRGKAAAKGALIGAVIGSGAALLIMAVQHARDTDFRVTPRRVAFAETKAGASVENVIVVRNTGTRQLRIESVTLSSGGEAFALVDAPAMPLNLEPGGEATLTIRFGPDSAQRFSSAVEIVVATRNREPNRVTVPLRGRGAR